MGVLASVVSAQGPTADDYFRITVVDRETGRGVPLVRLTTLTHVAHWTDSAGVIAFHEPGLMGRELWFAVASDGYEVPADGFGNRGVRLMAEPGASARVEIDRTMVAQRLHRLTGSGIYRDSVLLGDEAPIREPLLNAGVAGQDSTLVTVHRGRLFWIWGDTTHLRYPLAANFKVTGALSALPDSGGLDPEVGVNLDYFTEGDFVKTLAPLESPGPVWLSSLVSAPDKVGTERLVANYFLIKPPMDAVGRGKVVWNEEQQVFEIAAVHSLDDKIQPDGHPFRFEDAGRAYYGFPSDTRFTRSAADYESLLDHATYEAWTCLREGAAYEKEAPALDRDESGALRWAWKRDTAPIGQREQNEMIAAGHMTPEEQWLRLVDPATGKQVLYHFGSIYWNDYRQRWVMIFGELFGTSLLGEAWYAEADTPLGPWGYAAKVLTHEKYSFYNPVQHPHFAKEGGRVIFFEGTYASTFTDVQVPTPRYEYNQILYKVELDDERLVLPLPVYEVGTEEGRFRFGAQLDDTARHAGAPIAFYALDRPRSNAIAVHEVRDSAGAARLTTVPPRRAIDSRVAFHALPLDSEPTTTTLVLYESRGEDRRWIYEARDAGDDDARPVCRVWIPPVAWQPFAPAN